MQPGTNLCEWPTARWVARMNYTNVCPPLDKVTDMQQPLQSLKDYLTNSCRGEPASTPLRCTWCESGHTERLASLHHLVWWQLCWQWHRHTLLVVQQGFTLLHTARAEP